MKISLSQHIMSNLHIHKVAAVCIGYFIWNFLGDCIYTDAQYVVPVTIQHDTASLIVKEFPSHLTITVRALRKYLHALDHTMLKVVIPATALTIGRNVISLTSKDIGLPPSINLINYVPINMVITTEKKQ